MSNLLGNILELKPGKSGILKDFHVYCHKDGGYSVTHKHATFGEKFFSASAATAFLEKQPSPPPKETSDLLNYLLGLKINHAQEVLGFEVLPNSDGTFSVYGNEEKYCFQDADNAAAFLYSQLDETPEYLQVWGRATRAQEATCQPPYGYVNTDGLAKLCQDIHRYNVDAGWWTNIETGERLDRNVPEMLMLIVSEISEAMEGYRKNLMDDKLPHRKMIEVELADAVIRICDTAEGLGLDLAGAVREKIIFNTSRPDHKIENRLKENGKKF